MEGLNWTGGDYYLWALASLLIISFTGGVQLLTSRLITPFIGRKMLHLLAILTCAYVIYHTQNTLLLAWLFIFCSILLLYMVKYKVLHVSQGDSWGIGLFPLAFGIILLLPVSIRSVAIAATVLAIADVIAGIMGYYFGRKYFSPLAETKSIMGSSSFLIASMVLLWLFLPSIDGTTLFLLSLMITLAEALSWRGSDNLSIPLVAALGIEITLGGHLQLDAALVVLFLLLIGSPVLMKLRWLNLGGIVAALFMAISLAATIPVVYLLFPAIFLVLGSLLSRLNTKSERESNGRTSIQVLANGGVGIILAYCYGLSQDCIYIQVFIISFGIALCDTASSEIGRRFGGTTIDILNWKPVSIGLSGGISSIGSLGGILFAFLLSLIAYLLVDISEISALFIWIMSTVGMLIDSILGSKLQAKYMHDHRIVEKGHASQLIRGYRWINNDMVNLLSITVTCLLAYWLSIVLIS